MAEPSRDAEINVVGSINVFSAAAASGARRVINTSTGGAIYGDGAPLPTPETTTGRPLSAYGLEQTRPPSSTRNGSGLCVILMSSHCATGMCTVRGRTPAGDAGVIAIFCSRLLEGRRPMIFGDGRQTRDYVFVGDIVAANLAAARAHGLLHSIFNIGTGREVSVQELVGAVAEVAGVDPGSFQPEMRPPRAGEVLRSCLDIVRARKELQLADSTPLHDGLKATLDWIGRRPYPPRDGRLWQAIA